MLVLEHHQGLWTTLPSPLPSMERATFNPLETLSSTDRLPNSPPPPT